MVAGGRLGNGERGCLEEDGAWWERWCLRRCSWLGCDMPDGVAAGSGHRNQTCCSCKR